MKTKIRKPHSCPNLTRCPLFYGFGNNIITEAITQSNAKHMRQFKKIKAARQFPLQRAGDVSRMIRNTAWTCTTAEHIFI